MNIPSHKFIQPSSYLEPPLNMNMYSKNKDYYNNKNNPFVDDFIDPLCKLNLKETSEFVKSLPVSNTNAENRRLSNDSVTQMRKLEAPSTPGRPLFSFSSSSSSSIVGRNLPRKSFPSKWDDAEKWLISTSCHDSPAHNNNTLKGVSSLESGTRHCDNGFKQKMEEGFSEKSRVIEEKVLSKSVTNFQSSSSSLDHNNSVGAFNGISCPPTDIVLKDKYTDSIEPILPKFRYSEPTKEGFLFRNQACEAMHESYTEVIHEVKHKDVGTEMTPLGSSTTSRCHTPFKSSSPARHNTPASRSGPLALSNIDSNGCSVDAIQLEECHFSKLQFGTTKYDLVAPNWSSSEEEEKEISKSLRHNASLKADSDCIAASWEEDEKNKCCLRYQREEAKIQAWINLQNAKAEARSKKLEVKIQKMRSNLEEKLMKRMSVVHRKAEDWRVFLSLGYTFLVVSACIHAGTSKNAPPRDYSLEPKESSRVFSAFTAISIIAAIFGNGILPEIQATLAPPATGKMIKGLTMCYAVILVTFYSAAVSGYWVFGNKSNSNILKSLMPDDGPSLAPTLVLGLAIVFVLLQLFAIGLVYSQVAYEIMEKKSADVKQGMFSKRNLLPRLILRTTYMIFCGFLAAMLPFFGDINGVVGAVGFIPLDFVLPMILYNKTHKPKKSSLTYWINISIMVAFTGAGIMGAFSSIRKLVLDANQFKLFDSEVVD